MQDIDLSIINDCNHEEADTWMSPTALTKFCSEMAVVVLAIADEHAMGQGTPWIGFGSGKDYRYIPVHAIAAELPQNMCKALTFFMH